MKLIHTADICLDRSYAEEALPESVGRENRAHLRQRLEAVLERARSWPADGVLIAGNLFDGDTIERDTIGFLRESFEALAPVPVLISAGPLDAAVPTSPYCTELWPENVHLFIAPTWSPVHIGNTAIYGFGHDRIDLALNPFENLQPVDHDGPVVLMGPASVAAQSRGESTVPVQVDPATDALDGVTYIALGGAPDARSVGQPGGPEIWYPGMPEGAGFDAPGPHHYLEVTLVQPAGGGATAAQVVQAPISGGRFFHLELDCTDLDSGQALIDAVRPHLTADPDRQCVRIQLEGALLPAIYDEMTSIREALAEDVLFLDLVDRCFVAEDYEELARQKTSLGAFAARINQEIADAPDEHRRRVLCRSRDLALCAHRGQHLPIRSSQGD